MTIFRLSSAARAVIAAACVLGGTLQSAHAAPVTYDFEQFGDGDSVAAQIAGLTFINGTVLTAGISLNEFDFPPASGANVVFDDGGVMEIQFSSPVFSVGGAFTYGTALSFNVYDASDFLLGTVISAASSNLALSGDPGSAVNEVLSFASAGGLISRIVISGDAAGGSFVLDDLTVDLGGSTSVPEPATSAMVLGLLGIGVLPGGWMRRRRRD
ncbi:MAG: PEP-CTERM sorting domain-containing protein [Rubrivivax sp.]|nr:PEP-CTERM sorting domain-containing protein [Rubrivivax sp.]